MDDKPNLILFGKTGVGKSTIANMLTQGTLLKEKNYFGISDAAVGNPADCVMCPSTNINVFDTIGLGEPDSGSIPHDEAVRRIETFLTNIRFRFTYICIVKRRGRLDQLDPIIFSVAKQIFKGRTERNFVLVITDADEIWLNQERKHLEEVYGNIPKFCVQFPFIDNNNVLEKIYAEQREDSLYRLKNGLENLRLKAERSDLCFANDIDIGIISRRIATNIKTYMENITKFFTCSIQ